MDISKKHQKQLALIGLITGDIPYTIAGGFPRDLFFGVTPKDIDVWITYSKDSYTAVVDSLEEFAISYDDFQDDDGESIYQGESEDGEPVFNKIEEVLKCEDLGVDFIFVKDNPEDIYKSFDFNFNQFVLMHEFPVYKGATPVKELRQIKKGLTDERVNKIVDKFVKVFGKDAKKHLEHPLNKSTSEVTAEFPLIKGLEVSVPVGLPSTSLGLNLIQY